MTEELKPETIIAELRTAICKAEADLRAAKVIPMPLPERRHTNLDEARAMVSNALAYGHAMIPEEHKIDILISNLNRIKILLDSPDKANHDGPHQ